MSFAARLQQRFTVWALRGHPPEASPVVLTQRRVYVLPTRAGLSYAAMLAVMLIGSMNYGLSLGHLLTFLLGGLGVAAILHTFRNLAFLRITPGHAPPVFKGDTAHFGLVLANTRRHLRPALRLRASDGSWVDAEVAADDHAEVALPVAAQRRGWLALPRVTIETRYPLGLVRAWAYVQPRQMCLVYPHPADDAPPLPLDGGREQQGRKPRHNVPGHDDFAGLRDHRVGDSPRHIAWKAVARRGDELLLTKYFHAENTPSLWLDWNDTSRSLDIEQRLAILARWICDADAAGLRWGLRLPGHADLPLAAGDGHRHAGLQMLALFGK